MAKLWTHHNRLFHLRGWNAAIETVWAALAEVPWDGLTPDQKALRDGMFDFLRGLFPDEDSLKIRPTNAELAKKYAISPRTVTNWRREGCEFEEGKWAVWHWLCDQRIIPRGARGKFARQLQRRKEREKRNEWTDSSADLLNRVKEAKRAGLL